MGPTVMFAAEDLHDARAQTSSEQFAQIAGAAGLFAKEKEVGQKGRPAPGALMVLRELGQLLRKTGR